MIVHVISLVEYVVVYIFYSWQKEQVWTVFIITGSGSRCWESSRSGRTLDKAELLPHTAGIYKGLIMQIHVTL